jgi:hypothetical protein
MKLVNKLKRINEDEMLKYNCSIELKIPGLPLLGRGNEGEAV